MLAHKRVVLTALLTALLSAAPVAAQDHGNAGHGVVSGAVPEALGDHGPVAGAHPVDAHGADAGHEPDIFSGGIGNVIVTLLVFGLVIWVLHRFAWPHILGGLQARERTIRESIEAARRERQESERLIAEHRQQLAKARDEATEIIAEARRDAEVTGRRIQEEARAEAERTLARAKREIELAKNSALQELYDHMADLAVPLAAEVVEKSLSVDEHRALVSKSLERMRGADVSLS